jgi:hypothetical protein
MGEMIFLGIDEILVGSCGVLLEDCLSLATTIDGIGYGIGFKCPLAKSPAGVAGGIPVTALSDFQVQNTRSPLRIWLDERQGEKRYLDGMFRGAFPASILSRKHVDLLARNTIVIGVLRALSDELFLWELSDAEIPLAEELLKESMLLCGLQ